MFLSTEEAADRLQGHIEQFRESLVELSLPEAGACLRELFETWERQGVEDTHLLMRHEGYGNTVLATWTYIHCYDAIFRESGDMAVLCDLTGVELEGARDSVRDEMISMLSQSSVAEVQLSDYREMVDALVDRIRGLAN